MAEPTPLRWPVEPELPAESPPVLLIEQALIGALMANPSRVLAKLPAAFSSEHYLDDLHRSIHDMIVETGDGSPMTIAQRLGGTLEDRKYVAQCVTALVGIINVDSYAEAITEAFYRRQAIAIAEEIIENAKLGTGQMPAATIVHGGLARLDALMSGTSSHSVGVSLDIAMDQAIAAAGAAARGELSLGRSVGMPSVDKVLGGLENGTFNILAARPGIGKSALGMQWGVKIARDCKAERDAGGDQAGVLVFSLEMKAQAIGRRALAALANIGITDLKRGVIEGREARLAQARRELAGLPFWIEDAGGQNLTCIRQKCRAAKRRFGKIALIIVDHMQIVRPDEVDRRNGATQAIGRISNTLRDLSKEFDTPVLCLSQLSRKLLERDDKRPNLGDLRQSGDIEQDADTVSFLHREEYYLPKNPPEKEPGQTLQKWQEKVDQWNGARLKHRGRAELNLEKVRDGEGKIVDLNFHGPTTCFSDPCSERPLTPEQGDLSDWDDRYFDQGNAP